MTDETPVDPDETRVTGDTVGVPRRIGSYAIQREIARGGMGVVFEAVQESPKRTVALKVMKQGLAGSSALSRFRYESQVLARLRHPGIAQVYEAGTHEEGSEAVPFFAMEYIPNARSLTEYADAHRLAIRDKLELFARVCDAVQHGHQRGIVHRDLKPGNILVDSSGNPKIIDFGIARSTDSDMATIHTEVGQIVGSLQYMSPEQFEADPNDLDTRSDVYALGVILYELLSGRTPYSVRNTSIVEAARIIREDPPPKLGQARAGLRGELETIVGKAMEKDRERRYQSASGLAFDIRQYLSGAPITAQPAGLADQLRFFARRHRPLVVATAVVFVVLVVATTISSLSWLHAERERRIAAEQARKTQAAVDFLKSMVGSAVPLSFGDEISLSTVLDQAARGIDTTFRDDPITAADLHAALSEGYLSLWRWADAERHGLMGLDLRREAFTSRHPMTIESLENMNSLYHMTGALQKQRRILEELADAMAAVHGDDDDETLGVREELALVLAQNEILDLARGTAERVCEVRERDWGPEAEQTLGANLSLATVALEQRRYDEAETMARTLLERSLEILGPDSRTTRGLRSLLGAALIVQGKVRESEELYGNRAMPEDFGVVGTFQGEMPDLQLGSNIYVFWEAW